MKNPILLLVLSLALLSACGKKAKTDEATIQEQVTEQPAPAAEGQKLWKLASYGDPAALTPAPADMTITMTMDLMTNKVSGKSACNNYSATLVSEDDGLRMGEVISTKMACPETVMQMEKTYLDLLQKVNAFQIEGGQMIMTTSDGKQLVFTS